MSVLTQGRKPGKLILPLSETWRYEHKWNCPQSYSVMLQQIHRRILPTKACLLQYVEEAQKVLADLASSFSTSKLVDLSIRVRKSIATLDSPMSDYLAFAFGLSGDGPREVYRKDTFAGAV